MTEEEITLGSNIGTDRGPNSIELEVLVNALFAKTTESRNTRGEIGRREAGLIQQRQDLLTLKIFVIRGCDLSQQITLTLKQSGVLLQQSAVLLQQSGVLLQQSGVLLQQSGVLLQHSAMPLQHL
jgi:hypothetical protein